MTKIVTMMVADGLPGSVRSGSAETPSLINTRAVTLNVDASPKVYPDESILLSLTLEYRPAADGRGESGGLQLNERLAVTLESGTPLVVSRAVDPSGNRRFAVEVTATVMK